VCRELLIRSEPASLAAGPVTLTKAHMAEIRNAARAKSAENKPRRVRPVLSTNVGKAWRGPLMFTSA
jgi:hypothetical protein